MQEYLNKIDKERLPEHIAVIMDGNGRWAKAHGKPRVFGHKNGVKSVREISEAAAELGIGYLTLYAFSTENWNRPALEVTALMGLLVETIRKEVNTLNKNNIRLKAIGDLSKLPQKSQNALLEGIEKTSKNTGLTLILALNYSSRWEITSTIQKIAQASKDGSINPDQINEAFVSQQLTTADYPDPELLIRTSGEQRLSNYLLWQIAYSELYFTDVFWPDFRKVHLYKALVNYQGRERRFGKTSEQLK
jgi:undecaprenyl diphosphate synthase